MNSNLYLVYHDKPASGTDRGNIYFSQSTNGGSTWLPPLQVNSDSTTNDQWQPAITVKPDGTKLFIAWYDRRNAGTNNSLIQTYGTFATLPISGTNSFATNFVISTTNFPPVFTGVVNTNAGTFDPAYPPNNRNDGNNCPVFGGAYAGYMGDYNTAIADNACIYFMWGDNRDKSTNSTSVVRSQANVRFIRVSWPH